MIIPVIKPNTLHEYQKMEEKDLKPERPERCPKCMECGGIWKHGFYLRTVNDGDSIVVVRIQRFRCRYCKTTLSCLYSFLVPYRRTEAALMCEAVETYTKGTGTYLEASCGVKERASSELIFRWVGVVAGRAADLMRELQRMCIQKGKGYWRLEIEAKSPRAEFAKTSKKANLLNELAEVLELGRVLVEGEWVLAELASIFLKIAETKCWLLSQQTLQCELF